MFPMMFPVMPMFSNLVKLQNDYPEPPTVYALLNSYVNFNKSDDEKTPIAGLAKAGRSMFFNDDYPLSSNISREDFETLILNHFLMRRIGFDTVTAFKIQLNTKLCEIMPEYNKLFDFLHGWDLFTSGETISRTSTTNNSESSSGSTSANSSNTGTSATKYSDTPQNHIAEVDSGEYVSEYTKNDNSSSSSQSSSQTDSSSGNSATTEVINRSPSDKLRIYEEFKNNINHIYGMIFKELESLFYQNY